MQSPEMEIEIRPDGTVLVHVMGVMGPDCEKYAEMVREILGAEVVSMEHTHEYYETPIGVTVNIGTRG